MPVHGKRLDQMTVDQNDTRSKQQLTKMTVD